MLVTRNELRKYGAKCDNSWFDRRLTKHNDILIDGMLFVRYETETIKTELASYLIKLKTMPHLKRHNSDKKCKSVLGAVTKIEKQLECK